MNILRLLLCLAVSLATVRAQQEPDADAPIPFGPAILDADQLDQLLGPIALYPDALIALILPAATIPADIVLAARHLKDYPGDLSQVEHRAWDDSVKSLTRYPEVLTWMDENLAWTKQVGEAFIEQPAEVMKSIQRLRERARAAGTLVDTPQQQVLAEPPIIRIIPAQPDIIYVPRYDPAVVFVDRPVFYTRPLLTFGIGYRVGSWLAYDCDWVHHSIWIGDRHRHWVHHDWHRPLVPFPPHSHGFIGTRTVRVWKPPVRTPARPAFATVKPEHRVPPAHHPRTPPLKMTPSLPPSGGTTVPTHSPGALPSDGSLFAPHATRSSTSRFGGRSSDGQHSRPQTHVRPSPPAATTRSIPAAPPVHVTGPSALRSFPTVVAPTHTTPTRRHSLPAAPPLQINGPTPATPATVVAPPHTRSFSRPSLPVSAGASRATVHQRPSAAQHHRPSTRHQPAAQAQAPALGNVTPPSAPVAPPPASRSHHRPRRN